MNLARIKELEYVLSDIDSKVLRKYSHFVDDASLTKIKQERKLVEAQIKELSNEA
jgi:hypothetical protein